MAERDHREELGEEVVRRAERLTRLARAAVDDGEASAYREERDELLSNRGFTTRVRENGEEEVLVLHPEGWEEGGTIHPERIEEIDRAVEIRLTGAADPEDWESVEAHNRALARRVRAKYGEVHGENAETFADFMGNHYARRMETAGEREREEFLTDYFVRNAWPSADQRAAIERSLSLVVEVAKETE
ncbi:DUF7108 family protein [Natronorarus salvus]|uniref:DUF7108 family protein n=1 Tax=Natronorarus salvus TaxID=3117733 RepID=UPI002F26D2E2